MNQPVKAAAMLPWKTVNLGVAAALSATLVLAGCSVITGGQQAQQSTQDQDPTHQDPTGQEAAEPISETQTPAENEGPEPHGEWFLAGDPTFETLSQGQIADLLLTEAEFPGMLWEEFQQAGTEGLEQEYADSLDLMPHLEAEILAVLGERCSEAFDVDFYADASPVASLMHGVRATEYDTGTMQGLSITMHSYEEATDFAAQEREAINQCVGSESTEVDAGLMVMTMTVTMSEFNHEGFLGLTLESTVEDARVSEDALEEMAEAFSSEFTDTDIDEMNAELREEFDFSEHASHMVMATLDHGNNVFYLHSQGFTEQITQAVGTAQLMKLSDRHVYDWQNPSASIRALTEQDLWSAPVLNVGEQHAGYLSDGALVGVLPRFGEVVLRGIHEPDGGMVAFNPRPEPGGHRCSSGID